MVPDTHQCSKQSTCGGSVTRVIEELEPSLWKGSRNHWSGQAWYFAHGTMVRHEIIFPGSWDNRATGTIRSCQMS